MTGFWPFGRASQKKLRSGQCGCPGGGKEAIQPPLSTGSCNCQASEEEKTEPAARPVRDSIRAEHPALRRRIISPPYVELTPRLRTVNYCSPPPRWFSGYGLGVPGLHYPVCQCV